MRNNFIGIKHDTSSVYVFHELCTYGVFVVFCGLLTVDSLISFRVISLVMWKSYDYHIASEETSTHWGQNKMVAISQTTISNAFSWMKTYELRLTFHWNLFLRIQFSNTPALVQRMALRRLRDKPLCEPMMVRLLTHICVTRTQWVKHYGYIHHIGPKRTTKIQSKTMPKNCVHSQCWPKHFVHFVMGSNTSHVRESLKGWIIAKKLRCSTFILIKSPLTFGVCFKQHFDIRYLVFYNPSPPRMFLSMDLL